MRSIMSEILFHKIKGRSDQYKEVLSALLADIKSPFKRGNTVGIKLHWGEIDNRSFLPPIYAKEIAHWLHKQGANPFYF